MHSGIQAYAAGAGVGRRTAPAARNRNPKYRYPEHVQFRVVSQADYQIHLQVSYKCRPDFQNNNNFKMNRVKVHKIIPRVCLVCECVCEGECV